MIFFRLLRVAGHRRMAPPPALDAPMTGTVGHTTETSRSRDALNMQQQKMES
jgi:hypothetical protein